MGEREAGELGGALDRGGMMIGGGSRRGMISTTIKKRIYYWPTTRLGSKYPHLRNSVILSHNGMSSRSPISSHRVSLLVAAVRTHSLLQNTVPVHETCGSVTGVKARLPQWSHSTSKLSIWESFLNSGLHAAV